MKYSYFLLLLLLQGKGMAQLSLAECLEASRTHSVQRKLAQQALQEKEWNTALDRQYKRTQVGASYDYRVNPIIPAQIVPVGQFNPVPTSETRAIQFGTPFQQNIGVSVFQPLFQSVNQLKVQESEWRAASARLDVAKTQEEQDWEVVQSYFQIQLLEAQIQEGVADTLRSHQSYQTVQAKFKEGRLLKTEVNQALLQHRANLMLLQNARSKARNERIYLAFLTGLPWDMMQTAILKEPWNQAKLVVPSVPVDSLVAFQKLSVEEELIRLDRQKEKNRWIPTVGLQGFMGMNQFTQTGNPFAANSWFGNSYLGLTVQVPLQPWNQAAIKEKKWQAQLAQVQSQKQWVAEEKERDRRLMESEWNQIQQEIDWQSEDLLLWKENVALFQKRVIEGQATSHELALAETELQKNRDRIQTLKQQQFLIWIRYGKLGGPWQDRWIR